MADCSYSRCVQERRNIRRELQKWTKNMVYIVGLERIAEELMGRRKWKLYQECMSRSQHQQAQLPINNNVLDSKVKQEIVENDEQERLKDWSPQSKCYICVDGKLDSDHTTQGALSPRPSDSDSSESPSDSEAPPTLTPALHLLKNSHRHAVGARHNMTSLVPPAAAGLPFYQPLFASAPNWYLSSLARNLHQHHQQQQQHERMDVDKGAAAAAVVTVTEQPLDLSAKPGHSTSVAPAPTPPSLNNNLSNRLPAAIDTKHVFNCDFRAKPRMSAVGGRRTYTEEELQAALRDIQSGKLGTRRAAVIYGIPRSTLRNKVYKLAMERERESHLAPLATLSTLADDDAMDEERELSGAEEEKEVEKALQGPLLSMADLVRFADTPEALRALLLQQLKAAGSAGMEHNAIGPYIQYMLAEQPNLVPVLPEIMRKVLGDENQTNNGEHDMKQPPPQPSPANSVKVKTDSSDMDTDDSPANVILKIPSFKPTTSKNGGDMYRSETGALVSPPVTSESGSPPIVSNNMLSLREAIAKSISQKFQQSPEPLARHPAMEIDYKRVGLTPPLAGLPPTIKNHQHSTSQSAPEAGTPPATAATIHARPFPSGANNIATKHQPTTNNNTSSNSTQGGKGTRPKRGKYRNYDRDSLVEAVRAVQRGEMSVHRAGSYYGVPHSTLEYKVKERHLMRPRKRDPKPNPVDEKIASMKSQEIRNIPDKMKPVIKPPQKYPPTSPNGIKMPAMFDPAMAPLGYTPPPFPFWPPQSFPHLPLEYPRNPSTSQFSPNPDYFASQMMQQLQERSVRCHPDATSGTKSAREMAESLYDGSGANGSFLDGIIRSSLESGVPNATDKTNNKEDNKNVAPENMSNKALLDQLCRNSRITPLTKPTTGEPNSSGDESYRKVTSPLNFVTKNVKDQELSAGNNSADIQTIELSNDSNESNCTISKEDEVVKEPTPPSRIYVKPQFQELTKPENLKPEVLVRFPVADELIESNGLDTGSASDKPEVAQD